MSKSVLIVEKDLALMSSLREALKARGFEVDETTDGKGAPELIRRKKPECVVLAVDLDAGQNGYIICKKLKSDEVLAILILKTEREAQGKTYEFHRYDGAGHGFFYWHRPLYRPEQAMDGWSKVFAFFGKHLAK